MSGDDAEIVDESVLWARSRSGSHAGRGFRAQDRITAALAIQAWCGDAPFVAFTPEGLEDVTLTRVDRQVHAQIKSRRRDRGNFAIGDLKKVWPHLAMRLAADPMGHAAVVLERPLSGVDATGWDTTLTLAPQELVDAVETALAEHPLSAYQVLGRTHLVVVEGVSSDLAAQIAGRVGLPLPACDLHYSSLQRWIGDLADENGEVDFSDRRSFTVTSLERFFTEITEIVDLDGLAEAVRIGAVEPLDLMTALDDTDEFFRGIDVLPGHIAAGLTVPRPDLVSEIADGLHEFRRVAIVGPSGSGKSAALWMTAASMDHVRWFRLIRVEEGDVPSIMRLVRSMSPTQAAPIGFLMDDVGRVSHEGIDRLANELTNVQSAVLLAAAREEDAATTVFSRTARTVRPRLDEALAQAIFEGCKQRQMARVGDWREAFTQSEGLLLEFVHVVTQGARLQATIGEQVARRVSEERDRELELLAVVATAHRFGGAVELPALIDCLGATDLEVRRALTRLVDEHLLRSSTEGLVGLHRLRSLAIGDAIHASPPPLLSDSAERALQAASTETIGSVIAGTIGEDVLDEDAVVRVMISRWSRSPSVQLVASTLRGLRHAGFVRAARSWISLLDQHGVAPTHFELVFNLAMLDSDVSFLPAPLAPAISAMRKVSFIDARPQFMNAIPTAELRAAIDASEGIAEASNLLAALGEVHAELDPEAFEGVASRLADAKFAELVDLMSSARDASPELAKRIADQTEGSLIDRAREHPWVRDVEMRTEDDGVVVAANYRVVGNFQDDPHRDVVKVCRTLLALAPEADVVACQAVDPSGALAGMGDFTFADKRIPRRNLPGGSQVEWNRARGQVALGLAATLSAAERSTLVLNLLVRLEPLLEAAVGAWRRRQDCDDATQAGLAAVAEEVVQIPPQAVPSAPVLEKPENAPKTGNEPSGGDVGRDSIHFVCATLLPALFRDDFIMTAANADRLVADLLSVRGRERWFGSPEADVIDRIAGTLTSLKRIVLELHHGGPATSKLLLQRLRSQDPLEVVEAIAVDRARQRLATQLSFLRKRLAKHDVSAELRALDRHEEWLPWPPSDIVVICDVASIEEWGELLPRLASEVTTLRDAGHNVKSVPRIRGLVVCQFSAQALGGEFVVTPEPFDAKLVSDLPSLPRGLAESFGEAAAALLEASAIVAIVEEGNLLRSEREYLDRAIQRADLATARFLSDHDESSDPQRQALDVLLEMRDFFADELRGASAEEQSEMSLAETLHLGIRDPEHAWVGNAIAGARILLVEDAAARMS